MGKSIKVQRYKNIDKEALYDDIIAAAQSKDLTVTQYARMCGLSSSFHKGLLRGERFPTEHLLRQVSRDLKKAGVNRHWRDYLITEPEPVQMEMDLPKSDRERVEGYILSDIEQVISILERIRAYLKMPPI